jgi:DNA-binding transcriptional ArsR family regulator
MDWERFAQEMAKQGSLVSVKSLSERLGVSERTAVNYLSELRKRKLLETSRGRRGIRLYRIRPLLKMDIGYPGLYDTINRFSPIKVAAPYEHRIYDHEMTPEEAIVRAILTKDFRTVLASLALFSRVSDWSLLYKLAKKENLERQVGALYDVSRLCLRVRKMDGRIRNKMKSARLSNKYILPGTMTKDFPEIEREWGVFVPFRAGDLRKYKE